MSPLSSRVHVDPEEGVECLICGDVLRRIDTHVRVHGITSREYRKQFPGAPVIGPILRDIGRDLHADRVATDEVVLGVRVKREMCKRGLHELTGDNIRLDKKRKRRQCRACQTQAMLAYRRGRGSLPLGSDELRAKRSASVKESWKARRR